MGAGMVCGLCAGERGGWGKQGPHAESVEENVHLISSDQVTLKRILLTLQPVIGFIPDPCIPHIVLMEIAFQYLL